MRRVYLDNSATTQVDEKVFVEMKQYFTEKYGNAGSLHSFGQEAEEAVRIARERAAKLINADPSEIIFNSGGTESDNTAIKKIAMQNRDKGNHIITTNIEHPAVLRTCEFLESQGFKVSYITVNSKGIVDPKAIEKEITEKTILVSVMHANNEIGTIQPIEEIAKVCKERKIIFHTDAVQTLGKIPIDVKKMNIDLLSGSAHKLHGPKGVGLLYVRKGTPLTPLIHGGGQENGKRSGTENVAGIVGFGKACELAMQQMEENNKKMLRLRDRLVDSILTKIPRSYLNGDRDKRLPGNAHFRFDFIEGEALLLHLDMEGIAVSTGSACSSKSLKPSHVLTALGLKPVEAHGSIRVTMSKFNTEEEINHLIDKLPGIVADLRKMSPLNEGNINDKFPDEEDHCEH